MPHLFLPLLIVLCLLVRPAVAGVALYRGWHAGGGAIVEQTQPAPVEVKARSVARCPHCGRILSKRRLDPETVGHFDPPYYEYTVSMADGSGRTFREQMPATWRVGERLYYIDGTRVN
ncbi:MAG TPA: hypothetical protein VMN03_01235 [Burkholderiales bacterium]|nr:hypothetical protein [Burkholderiales bacterium]